METFLAALKFAAALVPFAGLAMTIIGLLWINRVEKLPVGDPRRTQDGALAVACASIGTLLTLVSGAFFLS